MCELWLELTYEAGCADVGCPCALLNVCCWVRESGADSVLAMGMGLGGRTTLEDADDVAVVKLLVGLEALVVVALFG